MRFLAMLALCCAAVGAVPSNPQRIVGGSVTTIDQYPNVAALLFLKLGLYSQDCGGTILNTRSILTAAHCTANEILGSMRIRVGSTWANSGGVVHNVNGNIIHPSYDFRTLDNNIAILRSATTISFNSNVRAAFIAGTDYNLVNNQTVWAAGWDPSFASSAPGQLRHVELMVINQVSCRNNYAQSNFNITDNMLCSGWPSDGRGQCHSDAGSPLYHNGVVVGVFFTGGCFSNHFHSVNTRVSHFASWILSNV